MEPARRKMAAEVLEGLVEVCSLWGCFSVFFFFSFFFFFSSANSRSNSQPNTPITQQSTCLRSTIDGKVTRYLARDSSLVGRVTVD